MPGPTGPARSHDAASYVEIMKIGFVSLLGDSRFLHATLFYVTTSICGILALYGHFFTFKSPPVKRRGFQTCGPCRVGRLPPLAVRFELPESRLTLSVYASRHGLCRTGPLVLAHEMA